MLAITDPRVLSKEFISINAGRKASNKGKMTINNGIKNRYISKSCKIPEGWVKGGKSFKKKRSRYCRPVSRRPHSSNVLGFGANMGRSELRRHLRS